MPLVIKTSSTSYSLLTDSGEVLNDCRLKGNLRLKGIRTTNPVAVGDIVDIYTQDDGTIWITNIHKRDNYIIRRATNLSKESQVIAANIDLAALVITLHHPTTHTTFVDRFLFNAECYHIPASLIFNKSDIYDSDEREELDMWCKLYSSLGYTTHIVSAATGEGIDELKDYFRGKTLLLAGNSGVGKSTLLNVIAGEELTRTADLSKVHEQGMHTTTFSQMHILPQCRIIDTPGVRGFGIVDIQANEVWGYFPEIRHFAKQCKYANCTHTNEPQCAVKDALEHHYIAISRWDSYLSIMGDAKQEKYRK